MSFSKNAWAQLKNKTTDELISALLKDGFVLDDKVRAERIYRRGDGKRVSIHYHSGDRTYGPALLKSLLEDIGWSEAEMKKLKLIR